MNKIIEIIINPAGEAKVQTKGFAGTSCRDASRFIEQTLGDVQSDVATAEMHLTHESQQSLHQR